jgi:hypothetical protein
MPAGLIQEAGHPRRHAAEACAGDDDNGIIFGEFLDIGDRHGLVQLEMVGLGDSLRHEFGRPLDIDRCTGTGCALADRLGHRFDMTIGRVIEDKDFGHVELPGLEIGVDS